MVNDEEACQIADEPNLLKAARWIQERGPGMVVVKKGEHGASLFADGWVFFVPGYPLEVVFDPTGAGDSFAGGFMGYLARAGNLDEQTMRQAVVVGSVVASFTVQGLSIDALKEVDKTQINKRYGQLMDISRIERIKEL